MNHKGYICPSCQQEINGFRDKLSKKEFQISGLCQQCQDKTFDKKYGGLSESDLDTFQEAIFKDYNIRIEGDELYQAAFNLLQFFEALIKFDKEGSKTVQDNPLYTAIGKHKIK